MLTNDTEENTCQQWLVYGFNLNRLPVLKPNNITKATDQSENPHNTTDALQILIYNTISTTFY